VASSRIKPARRFDPTKSPKSYGEQRYGVAISEGSTLWLTLWVKCRPDGAIFVMLPREDPDLDPHASYYCDGTIHFKNLLKRGGYHEKAFRARKGQPLTAAFRGVQPFVNLVGHGKGSGVVCDPKAFDGVVEVEPGVLAPHHGSVSVDLVEPGYAPKYDLRVPKRRTFPRGVLPSVVITIWANQDDVSLNWPNDFVKVDPS
jgi:hypothetical protein